MKRSRIRTTWRRLLVGALVGGQVLAAAPAQASEATSAYPVLVGAADEVHELGQLLGVPADWQSDNLSLTTLSDVDAQVLDRALGLIEGSGLDTIEARTVVPVEGDLVIIQDIGLGHDGSSVLTSSLVDRSSAEVLQADLITYRTTAEGTILSVGGQQAASFNAVEPCGPDSGFCNTVSLASSLTATTVCAAALEIAAIVGLIPAGGWTVVLVGAAACGIVSSTSSYATFAFCSNGSAGNGNCTAVVNPQRLLNFYATIDDYTRQRVAEAVVATIQQSTTDAELMLVCIDQYFGEAQSPFCTLQLAGTPFMLLFGDPADAYRDPEAEFIAETSLGYYRVYVQYPDSDGAVTWDMEAAPAISINDSNSVTYRFYVEPLPCNDKGAELGHSSLAGDLFISALASDGVETWHLWEAPDA